jgi:hypothetical protein
MRPFLVLLAVAALACATTEVVSESPEYARVPRPERVLVHTFAVSPKEVRLDHSVTSEAWKMQGLSESTERREVARKVADVLADTLVKKIQAMGLPAERVSEKVTHAGVPTVVIDGQFLAVDEGSRTKRVVIGLGAGKSKVRTAVQMYEVLPDATRLLDTFEVDAMSGSAPGMAETMGAGAAAGHLATSAAVSVAKSAAAEKFGEDVDADARRTADKIARTLGTFFAREGWTAAEAPAK